MKACCRTGLVLLLCMPSILLFFAHRTIAADLQNSIFMDGTGPAQPLDRSSGDASILLFSASEDPFTMGSLAPGIEPWLDLLDRASYSLKLSFPISGDSDSYGWDKDGGGFLSAGFLASVRFKSLPGRYGSWILNTGFFLIRKEQNSWDQPSRFDDSEYTGGIGTLNISIIY